MAAPVVLYVDDRNPLISYTPNSSWIRGGNVFDYERTSTVSSTPGTSASITFSGRRKFPFFQALLCSDTFSIIGCLKGTGISVFGRIERLSPGIPEFVLSSYSVDDGPTTTCNATEQSAYQFQQNFFQSGPLEPSPHTLVVTQLTNNARLIIDYFVIIPPNSSLALASTSMMPTSTTSSSTSAVIAPSPGEDGARTPTAAIIGGTLGGLALIGIAALVFWLIRKRAKNSHQQREQNF
jgi:hypothetical protein